MYRKLCHNDGKYRKVSRSKLVIIPNSVGIEHRPSIVDTKQRLGDWEVDTVLGKQGAGALVSLVECKSKLYQIRKVKAKSAEEVRDAMIKMLWEHRHYVYTITANSGLEFCGHEVAANALKADVYFANPYDSNE